MISIMTYEPSLRAEVGTTLSKVFGSITIPAAVFCGFIGGSAILICGTGICTEDKYRRCGEKKRWNVSANVGSKVRVVRDHLSRYVTILNIISDTLRLVTWYHGAAFMVLLHASTK